MTNKSFRYGELNPADHSQKGKTLDPSQYSGADWLSQVTEEARTPRFLKKITGPLQAVCIRVEQNSLGWFDSLWNPSDDKPGSFIVRARIPEIHAHLPDLDCYGPDAPEGLVQMYPSFVADEGAEEPEPGSIIWVDFKDRELLEHPLYIGKTGKKPYGGGVKCKPNNSPSNAAQGAAAGGLGNGPPTGDPIGGQPGQSGTQTPTPSGRYDPTGKVGGPASDTSPTYPPQRDDRLESLNPTAAILFQNLIDAVAARGLPMLVYETLRTQERQNYLYTKGRTRAELDSKGIDFPAKPNENKVTWTLRSKHLSGNAIDFVLNTRSSYWRQRGVKPTSPWDTKTPEALLVWQQFGEIARELGFNWGGFWAKKDWPHVETTRSQSVGVASSPTGNRPLRAV